MIVGSSIIIKTMKKPDLKITLQQISPALPDPYEFANKIIESFIFMDEHPAATSNELTPEMLEFGALTLTRLKL